MDVKKDGCWWMGRVAQLFPDHFTVNFPGTCCQRHACAHSILLINVRVSIGSPEEDPYPIWQPPRAPKFYCARYDFGDWSDRCMLFSNKILLCCIFYRTSKRYSHISHTWESKPREWFVGCERVPSKHLEVMLPHRKASRVAHTAKARSRPNNVLVTSPKRQIKGPTFSSITEACVEPTKLLQSSPEPKVSQVMIHSSNA